MNEDKLKFGNIEVRKLNEEVVSSVAIDASKVPAEVVEIQSLETIDRAIAVLEELKEEVRKGKRANFILQTGLPMDTGKDNYEGAFLLCGNHMKVLPMIAFNIKSLVARHGGQL